MQIFLACAPGLEPVAAEEAAAAGFSGPEADAAPRAVPGGVELAGGWPEVWRANLQLRLPNRVLVRIAEFPVFHLAQLDKRARRVPWGEVLGPDVPVEVQVTAKRSKIYHEGAATQRIAKAVAEVAPLGPDGVRVMARIERNLCTISLDTSGQPLHRRGHKEAVGKAPLRETLAAGFLRQCGYDGREPVVDPMCGSGTFVLEAAEIAAGLWPGRSRAFAFERLASFDAAAWAAMKAGMAARTPEVRFAGYDRDAGAVRMAAANAERAGVADWTSFGCQPISALERPEGPPGLVMVNPPYGGRIGNKGALYGLYASLGATLKDRFQGWRVGLVTSEPGLAKATTLPFQPPDPPVPHGGLTVTLWRTRPL